MPSTFLSSRLFAGASGDLARKKTYPSLQFLFCNNFLPKKTRIIGYARSPMSDDDLRKRLRPTLSGKDGDVEAFLSICTYMHGPYDTPEGYQALEKAMEAWENDHSGCNKQIGRLYYLALPPTVYPVVCRGLKENCDSIAGYEDSDGKESWIRVIVEKPFGRDVDSSEELAEQLAELYPEEQLYRIDHYLGKEMLQSLFVMRFANTLLAPVWDRASVASVQITFKEDFGTQGRGGYFDHYGIIRDMIATHLSQILAFVGMEKPMSQHPEDIRDEKLKLLRCLRAVKADDVVIGQYLAGEDEPGYLDDPTVPEGSKTPTYAAMVLYIDNDRWSGVPFIIRAGKALNERKAEIRLQLHRPAHFIFEGDAESMRNEVVIRLQPDEAIYCKVSVQETTSTAEIVLNCHAASFKLSFVSLTYFSSLLTFSTGHGEDSWLGNGHPDQRAGAGLPPSVPWRGYSRRLLPPHSGGAAGRPAALPAPR